ncbi:uncharacterized protein LOC141632816 [Silene latifolia]|uniref:uncharacterized protein LOC141632816 n=1 Tax=Silene latifolia TaxID=37657 RepID=UPI003D782C5B
MKEALRQQIWNDSNSYTIAKGYEHMRDKSPKIKWHKYVWNQYTVPKHAFLGWIYYHGNMNTKDKVFNLNICEHNTCDMCGIATESIDYLFFDCQVSQRILQQVSDWVGVRLPVNNIGVWRSQLKEGTTKSDMLNALLNACIYHIWDQRNKVRHDLVIYAPQLTAKTVIADVKIMVRASMDKTKIRGVDGWVTRILNRNL